MREALGLAWLLVVAACGGTSSSETHNGPIDGGGAQSGTGGSAGSASGNGGSASGSGGSSAGSGGFSAASGSGGCGPCPGSACGPVFQLFIQTEADASSLDLDGLQVQSPGFQITCNRNGDSCQYVCQTPQYQLANGHYRVTITARGFASRTIEFDAVAPTNCGCCGCCPFSFNQQISLIPDGTPAAACTR